MPDMTLKHWPRSTHIILTSPHKAFTIDIHFLQIWVEDLRHTEAKPLAQGPKASVWYDKLHLDKQTDEQI